MRRWRPAVRFSSSIERPGRRLVRRAIYAYDEAASEVEVGWTFLARAYWGGRYNGEMKRLMLRHAFRFVNHVVLLIAPTNIRSQRAAERIGAVHKGSRHVRGTEHYVFEITAPALEAL